MKRPAHKPTRWQHCNVLQTAGERRVLRQFTRGGEGPQLFAERTFDAQASLPKPAVTKTVSHLWKPRLNLAWLPSSQVFVRILSDLPAPTESEKPTEFSGRVESQLELVSPLPMNQMVWTFQPLPGAPSGARCVLALMAVRSTVEEYLGELETSGYLADRLELPQLHDVLQRRPPAGVAPPATPAARPRSGSATSAGRRARGPKFGVFQPGASSAQAGELPGEGEGDGICVHCWIERVDPAVLAPPSTSEQKQSETKPTGPVEVVSGLVAWWREGRLRNLNLLTLPGGGSAGERLVELLRQLAWAGEIEGWLAPEPHWRLVAEPALAAELEPELRAYAGNTLEVSAPLPPAKLAAVAAGANTQVNLVPADYASRYRQQFIDRLWMRGLAAVGLLYLLVVLIHFGFLRYVHYQKSGVDREVAALAPEHRQALELKARLQVFQEQANLRFAALDCWKAVAEALPEEMTLTSLGLARGKRLSLFGTVPADQQGRVSDFNEALSKAQAHGGPLFSQVNTRSIQAVANQPNRPANWSIECELKRADLE
ncbi:MAG: PilN domain-containing protein [Verrucomicrobia bacterium]|nr:PilN domain-containing protein [Verrucomicrobiota bacterium]